MSPECSAQGLCSPSFPGAAHPAGQQVRRAGSPLGANPTSEWGQECPALSQPPIMRQSGFSPGGGLPCACPAGWPPPPRLPGPTRGRPTTAPPSLAGPQRVLHVGSWTAGSGQQEPLGWADTARSGHGMGRSAARPAQVPVCLLSRSLAAPTLSPAPQLSLLRRLSPGHPVSFPLWPGTSLHL